MTHAFDNRYDIKYLQFLSDKLSIPNLKNSAIDISRSDKWKDYKPLNSNKTETLTKAVKIDFCGFAATTLLGTNMDVQRKDIEIVYPEKAGEIIQLKEEISNKFKSLFEDDTVREFNEAGIYLQVRFCFPYLYADFPITFMKAEDSDIWNATIDHEVSFSGNAPIAQIDWELSNLYISQQASLHKIAKICDDHKSFSRIKDYDKVTNTLETRFAVIPIPVCVLIINDVAITDSYIYAKVTEGEHLAFNTPINAIDRFSDEKNRENEKEDTGYKMLRQSFLYAFRHDMTMYADMATKFREKKPFGLKEIVRPGKTKSKWKTKIERMVERKKKAHDDYNANAPEEANKIKEWKENVVLKMGLCTRKIQDKDKKLDPAKLHIDIGKKNGKLYVEIEGLEGPLFHLENTHVLFCALVHYAYAQKLDKKDKEPRMHIWYQSKKALKRAIIKGMDTESRILDKEVSAKNLFHTVFYAPPGFGYGWKFRIPKDNITIDENKLHEIKKITYKKKKDKEDDPTEEISCLKGLLD